MSGQKSYKTEQEIEQNISSELKQGIDELDTINDFKISDVLNTDLTKFVEQSSKNINQSDKYNAIKAGGMRIPKREHKQNEVVKELKEQGVKQTD